jgi:mycothiol synthase
MTDHISVADAPRMMGLGWRRYRGPEDIPGMVEARQRCAAYDGVDPLSVAEHVPSEGDLERMTAHSDSFDPAQDMLIVTIQPHIIGYACVQWWTESDGIRLYLAQGWLLPAWRNRGIGTAMLHWDEARCRALAPTHPNREKVFYGANASEKEQDATALLLNNGYHVAFTLLEMGLDDLTSLPQAPLPPGFVTRPLTTEDLPALFHSMNECYSDHRFSEALDYVAWAEKQVDLTAWHVAWDEHSGEIAGQVQVLPRKGLAELEEVSVRAPHRHNGVARALMVRALQAQRERGVKQARLRTLAENPQQAWRVYESLGFRVLKRFPRYRKPMR